MTLIFYFLKKKLAKYKRTAVSHYALSMWRAIIYILYNMLCLVTLFLFMYTSKVLQKK